MRDVNPGEIICIDKNGITSYEVRIISKNHSFLNQISLSGSESKFSFFERADNHRLQSKHSACSNTYISHVLIRSWRTSSFTKSDKSWVNSSQKMRRVRMRIWLLVCLTHRLLQLLDTLLKLNYRSLKA